MAENESNQKRMKKKRTESIAKIIVAIITAIGAITTALISVYGSITSKQMDISEVHRTEEQEEQKELERKQYEETLNVKDRSWESRAGIEYLRCSIGTASGAIQFRVRPYLFCDVKLSTGKVIHCWIQNHYTQEEYLSENGMIDLLAECNQEVLVERLESLLENEGYSDIEIETYSLLLVEYSVSEVSPEYVCYCLKNGKLQMCKIEWGYELICYKENHTFNAECKNWVWVE